MLPVGSDEIEQKRKSIPSLSGRILTSFEMEEEIMKWIIRKEQRKNPSLTQARIKEQKLAQIREKFERAKSKKRAKNPEKQRLVWRSKKNAF